MSDNSQKAVYQHFSLQSLNFIRYVKCSKMNGWKICTKIDNVKLYNMEWETISRGQKIRLTLSVPSNNLPNIQ